MVDVRADHDAPAGPAGDFTDDVAGLELAEAVPAGERKTAAQRHRLEVRAQRPLAERAEVEAFSAQHLPQRRLGDPAPQAQVVVEVRRQADLLAAPGVAHHVPAVSGRGVGVDQQDARGAAPGRLLDLVAPPAEIRHAPPVEPGGLEQAGIVDADEDQLAPDVRILEIVPVITGRADAEADEDRFGVEPEPRLVAQVGQHVIAARFQGDAAAPGLCVVGLESLQREGLAVPGSVAGPQAQQLEQALDVRLRQLAAARAGRPAFQQVGSQELDHRPHLVARQPALRRRLRGAGETGQRQDHEHHHHEDKTCVSHQDILPTELPDAAGSRPRIVILSRGSAALKRYGPAAAAMNRVPETGCATASRFCLSGGIAPAAGW